VRVTHTWRAHLASPLRDPALSPSQSHSWILSEETPTDQRLHCFAYRDNAQYQTPEVVYVPVAYKSAGSSTAATLTALSRTRAPRKALLSALAQVSSRTRGDGGRNSNAFAGRLARPSPAFGAPASRSAKLHAGSVTKSGGIDVLAAAELAKLKRKTDGKRAHAAHLGRVARATDRLSRRLDRYFARLDREYKAKMAKAIPTSGARAAALARHEATQQPEQERGLPKLEPQRASAPDAGEALPMKRAGRREARSRRRGGSDDRDGRAAMFSRFGKPSFARMRRELHELARGLWLPATRASGAAVTHAPASLLAWKRTLSKSVGAHGGARRGLGERGGKGAGLFGGGSSWSEGARRARLRKWVAFEEERSKAPLP
jgi:hypothetical protein